ncbi:fibulin-2 [Nerophis lumbriciformis]|uniref:fibulin-2 n=1 Tax=Nerophis lumbriciformis TaxID=546530 RepID=UPI002AE07431|nr:fibulin-2-like [Nerophis lumbriciformis]
MRNLTREVLLLCAAKMSAQRRVLRACCVLLVLQMAASQKDCTGVECPPAQDCLDSVMEPDACCPTCAQTGCTCEGYQFYDCVRAGFGQGKVPEGQSYLVDFGSTECVCPEGGGKISCRFIECPQVSHNCIHILQPADGCPQCGRVGCRHGDKTYDAGHTFRLDRCQVCHCPNEGGKLMCSPVPGCERRSNDSNAPALYQPGPASFGTDDYDYSQPELTPSTAQSLFPATEAPPQSSSASSDDRTSQPRGSQKSLEKMSEDEVTLDPAAEREEKPGEHEGAEELTRKHSDQRNKSSEDHQRTPDHEELSLDPSVQFRPTSRPADSMRKDEDQTSKQPQNFSNYQTQDVHEVSVMDLVDTCCETGAKWASANGHCNSMDMPTKDIQSICWTSQQRCCVGSLTEVRCLAGVRAARGGLSCEKDGDDTCGLGSFKECCDCCSVGLKVRSAGQECTALRHMGLHCGHVFLMCCQDQDLWDLSALSWHRVREKTALDATSPPKKVSDSLYPKEAFSAAEEREGENILEGPMEVEDMDECLIYQGNICHHRCVNTPGSFRCECSPGYELQEDAFTCAREKEDEENSLKEDESKTTPPTQPSPTLNPCEGNGPCDQRCVPEGGRVLCSCFPGFSLMADGYSCEDIDECTRAHGCQLNERCVNTAGSYVCQRMLTCPPGYNMDRHLCQDIDECKDGSHDCRSEAECVNTEGSFTCKLKARCSLGFQRDSHNNCIDSDECDRRPCASGFTCVNTVGSYSCVRKMICTRGYHSSPDGSSCIDVDECESGAHRCGEGQLCHNLAGSYRCECQTGYQYDSFRRTCTDVNECWHYAGRVCAQTCDNTPGSFQCSCTAGFRLSSDGNNCEDVNECLSSPCSQECANVYGSYQCYCRPGYHLHDDGHTCQDIDECSQGIGHLCTYKCVNVPGSYECACPQRGYTMSPNGRSCRDIDECTTGTHNCSLAESCYNIQGDFRCLALSCPDNYRKVSDTRCERISCPNFLECQKSPLRITYYYLSFQSNILIPAQIFRIGPSPAYSGDNVIVSITEGNQDNFFSTRKLNAYTGAVYLHRQVEAPRDFLITVEMKLWRQGTFTTFHAKIYVFITTDSL